MIISRMWFSEAATDDWYSSDDEAEGEEKPNMADVLKNLNSKVGWFFSWIL